MATPTEPEDESRWDDLTHLDAILAAWIVPGPDIEQHQHAQRQVREAMPELGRYLDRAADVEVRTPREHRRPRPIGRPPWRTGEWEPAAAPFLTTAADVGTGSGPGTASSSAPGPGLGCAAAGAV